MFKNLISHINLHLQKRVTLIAYVILSITVLGLAIVLAGFEVQLFGLFHLGLWPILLFATWYDIREQVIPNQLIVTGITVALSLFFLGEIDWFQSLSAGISLALLFLVISWMGLLLFGKQGIGMGDMKLFFVLGLFLGWEVFWIAYLSILAGGIYAVIGLAMGKIDRSDHLPFVPFITAGALVGLLALPWSTFYSWWLL